MAEKRDKKRPLLSPPAGSPRRTGLRLLAAFVAGVVLTSLVGGLALNHRHRLAEPGSVSAAPVRVPGQGPWGQLDYTEIELERPDETLVTDGTPVPPTSWFFENRTERQVLDLFRTNGLSDEQQAKLTNKHHWTYLTNGWLVEPPRETVRGLGAVGRQAIYVELKNSLRNPFHVHPFYIGPEKFESWLEDTCLPEDKRDLFKSLTYVSRDKVCFSDYEVMESLCSVDERKCLAKAVSRHSSLLVRLRVGRNSDIEALVRYWGRGGRSRAIKPFLQSLTRTPGGTAVAISYFFPEFARMRLYTYPDITADPTALRQDCFWTALNFFNETPDNHFFDEGAVRKTLQADYTPIGNDYSFGDLILLVNEKGRAIHVCVYVADDVVFTKNGADPFCPWVLTHTADMLARYQLESGQRISLMGMRRNK